MVSREEAEREGMGSGGHRAVVARVPPSLGEQDKEAAKTGS